MRRYSELSRLRTFEERFDYLRLKGNVFDPTFGEERLLNQIFYGTRDWKRIRRSIITRDCGCDLGVPGYEIYGKLVVHHMNPITPDDIINRNPMILDPEFLILVSDSTHKAITYGIEELLPELPIERYPNDTCPWRR